MRSGRTAGCGRVGGWIGHRRGEPVRRLFSIARVVGGPVRAQRKSEHILRAQRGGVGAITRHLLGAFVVGPAHRRHDRLTALGAEPACHFATRSRVGGDFFDDRAARRWVRIGSTCRRRVWTAALDRVACGFHVEQAPAKLQIRAGSAQVLCGADHQRLERRGAHVATPCTVVVLLQQQARSRRCGCRVRRATRARAVAAVGIVRRRLRGVDAGAFGHEIGL